MNASIQGLSDPKSTLHPPVLTLTSQWGVKDVLQLLSLAETDCNWLVAAKVMARERVDLNVMANEEERRFLIGFKERLAIALAMNR